MSVWSWFTRCYDVFLLLFLWFLIIIKNYYYFCSALDHNKHYKRKINGLKGQQQLAQGNALGRWTARLKNRPEGAKDLQPCHNHYVKSISMLFSISKLPVPSFGKNIWNVSMSILDNSSIQLVAMPFMLEAFAITFTFSVCCQKTKTSPILWKK